MSYLKPTKSSQNKAEPVKVKDRSGAYSAMSGGKLNSSTGSGSGAPKMNLKALSVTNRLTQSRTSLTSLSKGKPDEETEIKIIQRHLEQSDGATMPRLHQPKPMVKKEEVKKQSAGEPDDEFKPMKSAKPMAKSRRSLAERRGSDSGSNLSSARGSKRIKRKDSLTKGDLDALNKISLPSKIILERSNSKAKRSSDAGSNVDSSESITKVTLTNLKSKSQIVESPTKDEFSAKKADVSKDKSRPNSSTRKRWEQNSQVSFAIDGKFQIDQVSEQASEVSFSPNKKQTVVAPSQNDMATLAGGSSVDISSHQKSSGKKSMISEDRKERIESSPERKKWNQTLQEPKSTAKTKNIFDECDDIGGDEQNEGIAGLKEELERNSLKSRPSERDKSPGKRKQWTSIGMQERQNDMLKLQPAGLLASEGSDDGIFDPPKEQSESPSKDMSLLQAQEALRDQVDVSLISKEQEEVKTARQEDDEIDENYKALFLQTSLSQIDDRYESEASKSMRISYKSEKPEDCEDVADNSYLFNYIEKHYDEPEIKDPEQEVLDVSQHLSRPLTLQEKIEIKKLALLKKQGKKEEYVEFLNKSTLMNNLDVSRLGSPSRKIERLSPEFNRPSVTSEDSAGLESRLFRQLDQEDDLEIALRNYKHLELDDIDEPDYMYAILFDASHENHWDDHDFDFDQVLFEERKRDDFESFDEFKIHKSKKMQINCMLTQKQQQRLINAKKKNQFNITNTVNKIFGYFATSKTTQPRIEDLIAQKLANRKAKKPNHNPSKLSMDKLTKNEKLSKVELNNLKINLANLSLKKFKNTSRRLSARKDNLCHHAPEVDPFQIKNSHKSDKISKQIDGAIMTNIKWKLIGVEHPSESPKKSMFVAAKKKPVVNTGTKSPISCARSKSPMSNNERTSYLQKSPINDQWYKYVFEDLEASEESRYESPAKSGAPNFVNLKFQEEIKNLSSQPPESRVQTHRKMKSQDMCMITPPKAENNSSPSRENVSNHSRFTLHSNLSNFQNLSSFRLKHFSVNHDSPGYLRKQRSSDKSMTSIAGNYHQKNQQVIPGLTSAVFYPPEDCIERLPTLKSLLEQVDMLLFIRLVWLLSPVIKPSTVKRRLFNIPQQVCDQLSDVQQATCLYFKDDLVACIKFCSSYRQVYLKQKSYGFKKNEFQLDSREVAKIYIIELSCLVEQINLEPENEKLKERAIALFESIPIIVKSRQQHQFTILELFLMEDKKRAFSKLKDIDFISYKLFKLHSILGSSSKNVYIELDQDEQKSPEQYCKDIQEQFNKVNNDEYLKKLEFFVFGCLSALRNNHFYEAFSFINQAPIICNFGENDTIQTIIYFEIFKMVETKLMTKIGKPEQGIVMLANQYFEGKIIENEQYKRVFPWSLDNRDLATFDEQIFLCPKWTLYKILKYQIKLMEFRQDHFKFKMVQSNSQDGLMLQKANDDFCNVISHLRFLNSASKQFQWLLFKTFLKIERQNKIVGLLQNENFQMIYKLIDMLKIGSEILTSPEIQSIMKKKYNSKLVEYYFKGYAKRKEDNTPIENFNENEEGDHIFAKEKAMVSNILQNQNHFYLLLQNILNFVAFKTENIALAIKISEDFNYFDKLKVADIRHRQTANLSHALHILLNCVNILVFHDMDKSQFNIDVIYINEKEMEQLDLFGGQQKNPKHVASFGKGDQNISVDFEGGSQDGAPDTARSKQSSIYKTMKVDYFNQKYSNPEQKEEGYSNRFVRMAQFATNFENMTGNSPNPNRTSPKFASFASNTQNNVNIQSFRLQTESNYTPRGEEMPAYPIPMFDSPRGEHMITESSHGGLDSSRINTHRVQEVQIEEIDDDQDELSFNACLQNEEEQNYFDMFNHSIYDANTLYQLLTACCLSDSNQKLAIKIAQTLIKLHRNKTKAELPQYMLSIDIVLALIYLRLNHKQYQKQQSNLSLSHNSSSVRGAGGIKNQERKSEKSNTSNLKIQANLQTQDYFLQQSLRHFKKFNADKHLKRQTLIMVTMYSHVQKELVAYKLLSKHFNKDVKIREGKVILEKSKYQQHQMSKLDQQMAIDKGALAAFTHRERSKSISLFEKQ